MKKVFAMILAVALAATMLVGCSAKTENTTTEDSSASKPITITYIVSDVTNPFNTTIGEGVAAAEAELRAQGHNVTATFTGTTSETMTAEQLVMVEDTIVQGVDGICLGPTTGEGLINAVIKANEAGIPMINVDNRIDVDALAEAGGVLLSYIGSDNYQGAVDAAGVLGEALKDVPNAKVAVLEGTAGQGNTYLRTGGFMEGIAAYDNIEVVASQPADYSRDKGYTVMQNIIQANPDIVGLFANNDEMALGAIQALKDAGMLEQVAVVGFDGTKDAANAVIAGEMLATMAQDPFNLGYSSIMMMFKAVTEGTDGIAAENLIPTSVINIENAEKYLAEKY